MGGDVILYVDDDEFENYYSLHCRICHEEEFESSRSLESPCACSGTVKFAHRDCIQRWCDEKGNTSCEICLQNYETGYTAPVKKTQQANIEVTISNSEEIPRREDAIQNAELLAVAEGRIMDIENSPYKSASFCRSVAIIFTVLLLLRHLHDGLIGGVQNYPFTLLTVVLLKICGILLPMFIVIRGISAIQNSIRRHHHLYQTCDDDNLLNPDEIGDVEQQQDRTV